jgi:sulfhydrogenase subunit beta (sulfur reductase)
LIPMTVVTDRGKLRAWLEGLHARGLAVFPFLGPRAPKEMPDRIFTEPGSLASIKGLLLPVEPLLERPPGTGGPLLVWGVRPCDMKGVALIDEIFRKGFDDSLYEARRSRLRFAGVHCREEAPTCFCGELGVDRTDGAGMDLLVVEEGEAVFIKPLTKEGQEILARLEAPFEAAAPSDEARVEKMIAGIRETRIREESGGPRILRALESGRAGEALTGIADTCLACGVCSFVCPLCWCFDVRDVPAAGSGAVRVRCWDSCQLGRYARMAGGADPYLDAGARARHRLLHKFVYIPRTYGMTGCTGCGRCARACPSGLDLHEILRQILEEEGS